MSEVRSVEYEIPTISVHTHCTACGGTGQFDGKRCWCQKNNPLHVNLALLRGLIAFAYEQGYHEHGYDVLEEACQQLRQPATASGQRVKELEAESHKNYCRAIAMFYSGKVDNLTGADCVRAAAEIDAILAKVPK